MNITSANIRAWSRLGQRGAFFGVAMPEIAEHYESVMLLTADLALLSGMDRFKNSYPDKFFNVGIAEQNMIGIAAGLAMDGNCVFATTYASFIAVRSLEHVRQHLAHMQCNVKIVGSAAGVVAAKSGISHWATEDIAFIRALPNIMLLSAADSLEAIKMAEYAASVDTPIYIRLSGGLNCPIVYKENYDFIPGKMVKCVSGQSVCIIATGLMVAESIKAAEILKEKGVEATVYNMHTIKPLDKEELEKIFKEYELIVTVEEHNVIGGMGSAVAEYKTGFGNAPKQILVGFDDTYSDAGSHRFVLEENGLIDIQIADRVMQEMGI